MQDLIHVSQILITHRYSIIISGTRCTTFGICIVFQLRLRQIYVQILDFLPVLQLRGILQYPALAHREALTFD
jgi:hypothetical protein